MNGQGWAQVGELALAFALSAVIGLERQLRQKSAGLRTHTIVGLGSALFLLVSKYGFQDVVVPGQVVFDPSRVAAQIVSGLGFIGAGLIFVQRGAVRGLTTAATIWLTAAIGTAAAAGLPLLALLCTAGHFGVLYGLTPLAQRLSGRQPATAALSCTYVDGRGVLRDVLATCTNAGWAVTRVETAPAGTSVGPGGESGPPLVRVGLELRGTGPNTALLAELNDVDGVVEVRTEDTEDY
ncbi:MAG TPA: MgtC/SapB family protein [Mycobacteriales bacterium]|jgi:putative Mg2+ transporter-C (MgtC) family protein|nr:MgtC/SapB family protein [Mycobacteriales bacterium]